MKDRFVCAGATANSRQREPRSFACAMRAKGLLVAAGVFTLLLAIVVPSRATDYPQTFPVKGTALFETGVRALITDYMLPADVMVDWGDGKTSSGLLTCSGTLCTVYGTHRYLQARSYPITVSYHGPLGFGKTATTTATVSPLGKFVILSIGDSIASGEGNPVIPLPSALSGDVQVPVQGFWDDPASDYSLSDSDPDNVFGPCDRSSQGGFAQAGNYFVATNPSSDITFVNYACSGAKVSKVISMLRTARGILPRIDVLMFTAGADNIGGSFGNLLLTCVESPGPNGPCNAGTSFAQGVASDIDGLPGLYAQLADSINCVKDGTQPSNCTDPAAQIPKVVLIAEYHDPTHNQDGVFPPLGTCIEDMPPSTWSWLYSAVVVGMNDKVDTSPWHHVRGIQQDFLSHGYCAKSSAWVVTGPDSFLIQGNKNGTGHPNGPGQTDYKNRIVAKIIELNPPETTPAATSNGQPYAFGTWTTHDVTVTLSAQNPISQAGVGDSLYAVDQPDCSDQNPGNCTVYTGPFTIDTSGQHTIYFFSSNTAGAFEKVQTEKVLVDKDPPAMTCAATPPALWPPNNKMTPVTLHVTAVSAAFGPTPFSLTSLTASETGAAGAQGFVIGQASTQGSLRASRTGYGLAGQVYTFVYQSTDPLGLTGTCTTEVVVPHDRRRSNR